MPRRCTICTHKEHETIDQALVAREPFRHIATQYSVSTGALVRHSDDHIPADLVRAKDAAEAARADNLLAEVRYLQGKALGVLGRAEKADNFSAACAAIREARGCIELLGKLAGKLKDGPTINLFVSAEWRIVQETLLIALEPHPEARLEVVSALALLENGHAGHA